LQGTILSLSLLLVVGVALLVPGQVALSPGAVADVIHTLLITALCVLAGIATWNLALAAVRLWQRDDRQVAG
jgi:hypothetical protein